MSFAAYYAEHYDVPVDEAERRLALVEALRPHLTALHGFMRDRYAAHIDRSARDAARCDSLECYIHRGRAAECATFAEDFRFHIELVDGLHQQYLDGLTLAQ